MAYTPTTRATACPFNSVTATGKIRVNSVKKITTPAPPSPSPNPFAPDSPPGLKPSTCFVPGTPVLCPGGWRRIESIANGETVLAWNSRRRCVTETLVTHADVHRGRFEVLVLETSTGEKIHATRDHPFFDGTQWLGCEELARSGRAFAGPGKSVRVSIGSPALTQAQTVHNLQTEAGTYLVGRTGLVVSGRLLPQGFQPGMGPESGLLATRS